MLRSLDRGPRQARCSPDGVEGAKDGAPNIVQRVGKAGAPGSCCSERPVKTCGWLLWPQKH